ncbi:MAG: hypothetical protein JWR35_3821 [Marmoricola sp.]|nr:hypothetical protein [Marmoricola sp.]
MGRRNRRKARAHSARQAQQSSAKAATSKLDPRARDRGLRFRIGDAFPADDPIARWATVVSMAINDTIYVNVRMIEGDLPPELDLYYFRLVAGHFIEVCTWLAETPAQWPEVQTFLDGLPDDARNMLAELQAFASQRHPLHSTLTRSRNTLFHYPTLHPARDEAGVEELANAMREASDLHSSLESGKDWASFRARFADEVAVQFVSTDQAKTRELFDSLQGPMFSLVEFGQAVLLEHLKRLDPAVVQPFGPRGR